MSELGPTAKMLLAAARSGLGPDAATVARIRSRVAATVAPAGAAATIGVGKLIALAVIVATTGVLGVAASARHVAATAPRLAMPVVALDDEPVVAIHIATAEPVAPPAPRPPAGRPDSGRPDSGRPDTGQPDTGQPDTGQPDTGQPDTSPEDLPIETGLRFEALQPPTLAREVELVDRAMAALRRGRPADALEAIASFDRETDGKGQLAQDAAAIATEARCLLHDPSAAADLAAFDQRWPRSAQRWRLTAACKPAR